MSDSDRIRREVRNARDRARRAANREAILREDRARRDALKRRMIAFLGGACVRCRRTVDDFGHVAAFDFHHRDPREKSFMICRKYSYSWARLESELRKCELLCASCHRVIEALAEEGVPGAAYEGLPEATVRAARGGRPPVSLEAALARADAGARAAIRQVVWRLERRMAERRAHEAYMRMRLSLFDVPADDDSTDPGASEAA